MHSSGPVSWLTALPIAVVGLLAGALVTFVGMRSLSGRLPRNRWVGIRTRSSMASDEAFAAANRVGAPLMVGGGVVAMVGGLLAIMTGVLVNGIVGVAVAVVTVLIMGIMAVVGGIMGSRAARRLR